MTHPLCPADAHNDTSWYLAQLRPNQFNRARRNLERQGYRCFMPIRPVTRRTSGRMRTVRQPLFPGYLFLTLGERQSWHAVNGTFGVVRLVMRNAATPQPVPACVMAELFANTSADGVLTPPADFVPGETVRVHAGPMAGFIGQVERLDGPGRVAVLMEMMGQAVRTSLQVDHAERLGV